MSALEVASLAEIANARGVDIGPELAALTARHSSLLKISVDKLGDPIDDSTAAVLCELSDLGVFDREPSALVNFVLAETAAITARVDTLATLLGIDN